MIELRTIKQQCRIEPGFLEDDALISVYLNAAIKHVENYTERKLYPTAEQIPLDEYGEPDDDFALIYNDAVHVAMLLMIGHWYSKREAVTEGSTSELPLGVSALLGPYRIYGV